MGKKTKMLRFIFAFFFHFSISHSNVIHRIICVKDFLGITLPKILKFGTNVGYDLLYCVRSASSCISFYLFVHFSFPPFKFSVTDFSTPMGASIFKFCIHIESGQVYCGKENQDAEIHFILLFPFFFLFSHLSLQCNT